ncbi:MAG TPA: hypothetical protein VFZ62_03250 [Candidatus Saccharimonadales bacterium]
MAESLHESPDIYINGRPIRGRTNRREDGSYESLDLMEIEAGKSVLIVDQNGIRELVKTEGDEHASSLENWQLPAEPERELGDRAVRLVLLEPNPTGGSSFLTPSVVLRERMEVGYIDEDEPNVIKSLGVAAGILTRTAEEKAALQESVRQSVSN